MGFKENLSKALDERTKDDPAAAENVVYEVRKTVPRFSFLRLQNLLSGQLSRDEEIGPLANALKVHRRQLIARTPQDQAIADFAVQRYRNIEDGNKVERFCEYAENSANFRQGTAELDLDPIAVAFEADDEMRIENEVFRLPSDEQQP